MCLYVSSFIFLPKASISFCSIQIQHIFLFISVVSAHLCTSMHAHVVLLSRALCSAGKSHHFFSVSAWGCEEKNADQQQLKIYLKPDYRHASGLHSPLPLFI